MIRKPMARVAVGSSVIFLVVGMFVSGVRVAQLAHSEHAIASAPVQAQRAAERMWTNELALNSLRIETFKLKRCRIRLKTKRRQFSCCETAMS